jgi:hypothetical protein
MTYCTHNDNVTNDSRTLTSESWGLDGPWLACRPWGASGSLGHPAETDPWKLSSPGKPQPDDNDDSITPASS